MSQITTWTCGKANAKINRSEIELLKIERENISQLIEDLFERIDERGRLQLTLDDQLPLMIMQVDKMIGHVQMIDTRIADLEGEMNNRWRRVERLRKQEMSSEGRKYHELAAYALEQYKEIERLRVLQDEALESMIKKMIEDPHPQVAPTPEAIPHEEASVYKPGIFKRAASKIGSWFSRKRGEPK